MASQSPSSNKDTAPLLNTTASDSSDNEKVSYNAVDANVHVVPKKPEKEPWLVYLMTLTACIGGFLFGYDTGVVSGAMIFVTEQFNLSSVWHELIVSITIGAAALFALIGGYFNARFGRKPTIIFSSIVFSIGAILLGFAFSKVTLLIGRFVLGCGIGLASTTIPVYISETTPPRMRGRLVTSYNLAITLGLFCATVVAGLFSFDKLHGWRYMMGLAAVPALVQLVMFYFMPESPRWLCQQQRPEAAKAVLRRLVPADRVDSELEAIQFSMLDLQNELEKMGGSENIPVRMVQDATVRKILFLACGLQFFQQLSGINTIMYYGASIIQMAGVTSDEAAIWLTTVVSFINFIFTFVGIALVDRIGRRPLLIGSLAGVIGSLVFLAVGFTLAADNSPAVTVHESLKTESSCTSYTFCEPCVTDDSCGFCFVPNGAWAQNGSCLPSDPKKQAMSLEGRCSQPSALRFQTQHCPSHFGFMAVLGLGLYLGFFAPGMGPMPWTVNAEIFPLWARSAGNGTATAVNWITNLFVSMTFLTLTETITKAGTMWLYAGISFLGLIFIIKTLPETKGKALEEILQLFTKPWFSEGPSCCGSKKNFEPIPSMTEFPLAE